MDIIKETGNRQETGDRRQDTGEETEGWRQEEMQVIKKLIAES